MVVLRGRLSNPEFQDLLKSLTISKSRKGPARWPKPVCRPVEQSRRLGDISRSVVAVLAQVETEMRVRDIHREVEKKLRGPVSFYTVADCLHKRSKGAQPLFERT